MATDSAPQIEPPECYPALALPNPDQLIPAAGWALKGEHGHMAFETTKAGRLVSLKALVHWLMDSQEMPCTMAVDAVCDKLQDTRAASWLYLVEHGKLARPLASDDDFSYLPIVTWDKRASDPKDCGIAGALAHMRDLWCASASPSECNYMGAHTLDPLAIRMDVAHALWGWGTVNAGAMGKAAGPTGLGADDVTDYATLCQFMQQYKDTKGHERPLWRAEWVAWAHAEVDARGNGKRAAVAGELGMSSQALAQVFARHSKAKAKAKAKQATPWDVLNSVGKAA